MGLMVAILYGLMVQRIVVSHSPQKSIVDTTGAGDSFHGAFLANLAHIINHMKGQETISTSKSHGASIRAVELIKHCAHSDLEKAAILHLR